MHCSMCQHDVEVEPPNDRCWALIGSFWAVSLLFGIAAATSAGWTFLILVMWVLLASAAGLIAQHAMSWSCAECGTILPPPVVQASFFVNGRGQ